MQRPTDHDSAPTHVSWRLTGNHYLAVPCIAPSDGAIHRINVLHRGMLGLVEWAADREPDPGSDPLLAPRVRVDGAAAPLTDPVWEEVDRWIPRFRVELPGGLRLTGTVFTPVDAGLSFRGAIYLLELENGGSADRSVEVALEGTWRWSLRTIVTGRPLAAENRLCLGGHVPGIVLEPGGAPAIAALAVVAGGEAPSYAAAPDGAPLRELRPGDEIAAPNAAALRFRAARTVRVPERGRAAVAFYLAVAPERDGALATALDLRRIGAGELLRRTRLELARLGRRTADPGLGRLLNRNLFFNYFYAVGRALDDDRLYPLASRSPLYDESAVFRERDALLWSLPALTLADPPLAREVLLRAFEQYSHRPGERAHYLDGVVLAPGFALDQHCAYIVALDRYVREADDPAILDVPLVQEVLRELDAELFRRLHPQVLLCASELLPSGETADHPFVTYSNVLVWAACEALPRVWTPADENDIARFADAADDVSAAIWRHATAEVDGLRVLACSTDLAGEAAVYDDPAGSLALLPYLGFCDVDDPIWRNTTTFLHSERYPFWLADPPYPGLACRRHPARPSTLALCADLLGSRRDEALDILRRLELDGGFACESYDPQTGRAATGRHFAAAAGFLAWSLWHTLEA